MGNNNNSLLVIVWPFFFHLHTGTRAPGSSDIPKDKDDKAEGSNKSGMSAGAIAGIVLGVVGFIVVMTLCGYAANRLSGIKIIGDELHLNSGAKFQR